MSDEHNTKAHSQRLFELRRLLNQPARWLAAGGEQRAPQRAGQLGGARRGRGRCWEEVADDRLKQDGILWLYVFVCEWLTHVQLAVTQLGMHAKHHSSTYQNCDYH